MPEFDSGTDAPIWQLRGLFFPHPDWPLVVSLLTLAAISEDVSDRPRYIKLLNYISRYKNWEQWFRTTKSVQEILSDG